MYALESEKFTLYGDIDDMLNKIKSRHTGDIYVIGGSYRVNNLVFYLGYCNKHNKK